MIEKNGPYAVIVSDMRMPVMDGVQFLAKTRERSGDSTRIMLTGNADQQTAIEAVNEGSIFRFLTKPCSSESLARTLNAAIVQYRLVRSEKELLEHTLRGSIQVLTDVLSLVNPTAFGRASRVSRLARQIAKTLNVENAWQVEIAAMLSQIGCITVPEETLVKVYNGRTLALDELQMLSEHPKVGHSLINKIPRLSLVAEIIAYQEKLYNGAGFPHDKVRGAAIPLGSRILKLALDFDKLSEAKLTPSDALNEIDRRGEWYDPEVVLALKKCLQSTESQYVVAFLKVSELRADMILVEDVKASNGFLLIAKGQEVSVSMQIRLENFQSRGGIREPLKVLVPAPAVVADFGAPVTAFDVDMPVYRDGTVAV